VHAVVVAACSPYLRALLSTQIGRGASSPLPASSGPASSGPPSSSLSHGAHTLKGVSSEALEAIVRYMYTDRLDLSADTVMATLAASDLLQLDGAKALCCEWLEQHIDCANAFLVQAAAERYGCGRLLKTTQRFVHLEFADMVGDASFLELGEDPLKALLTSDDIRVRSEAEVVAALVRWARHDVPNRREAFGRLMGGGDVVRLGLLSGAELHEVNMMDLVQSQPAAMAAVGREACSRLAAPKPAEIDRLAAAAAHDSAPTSTKSASTKAGGKHDGGAPRPSPAAAAKPPLRTRPRRWMDVEPRRCTRAMRGHAHAVYALMQFDLKLVSGSADHTIKVWDPLDWSCEQTLSGHEDEVATLAACRGMLLSGSGDRTIKVWDPSKGWACTHTMDGHQDEVCALVVCRGRLVSASADHSVRVWTPGTWACERVLNGHEDVAVALTVCGGMLVSGSEDGTFKVWNPDGWRCEHTVSAHDSALATLTTCGGRVASGSADSSIKIWNPKTWTCDRALEGHRDQVCVLVQAGEKLVSASGDATIKVWDTSTWTCDRTLEGHEHPVVALSTCSGRLVSGSGDGIKVWE
jgi:hypothetical protein